MKEKVTIIVPIYNVEQYVKKCLLSLLGQTYQNIVIFAVNDGSTDRSGEIMDKVAREDARIRCIHKKNGGYGSVLELAIKKTETQYFLICDPDDWLEKDCVKNLMMMARQHRADLVAANKYLITVGSNKKQIDVQPKYFKAKANKVYHGRESNFYFMSVSPHSKLYKTNLVNKLNFPKKTSFTDLLLFVYATQKAERIIYLDSPLSNYLLDRPGNTKTDRKPKTIHDHITVWNEIMRQCDTTDSELIFRQFFEFKNIVNVYARNSEKPFNDKYYNELKKMRNYLKPYYDVIVKKQAISHKDRVIAWLALRRKHGLNQYVGIELLKYRIKK